MAVIGDLMVPVPVLVHTVVHAAIHTVVHPAVGVAIIMVATVATALPGMPGIHFRLAKATLSRSPVSQPTRARKRILMQVRRAHRLRAVPRVVPAADHALIPLRIPERALMQVRRAHRLRAVIRTPTAADPALSLIR